MLARVMAGPPGEIVDPATITTPSEALILWLPTVTIGVKPREMVLVGRLATVTDALPARTSLDDRGSELPSGPTTERLLGTEPPD